MYGFKKMVTGESPRMLFDLVMNRFEENYNPTMIYAAACRAKEVGMNREPQRFSRLRLTSDPLHNDNHTTCASSFNSNQYDKMHKMNKEACKQFNSLLRNIHES